MEYLQKSFTMKQILHWRLHWLYCDVSNLIDKIKHDAPNYNGGNTKERIEGYAQSMQDIYTKMRNVVWETSTMIDCDYYHSDVTKEMKAMDKYVELMETIDIARLLIKECMDKQLSIDKNNLDEALKINI